MLSVSTVLYQRCLKRAFPARAGEGLSLKGGFAVALFSPDPSLCMAGMQEHPVSSPSPNPSHSAHRKVFVAELKRIHFFADWQRQEVKESLNVKDRASLVCLPETSGHTWHGEGLCPQ